METLQQQQQHREEDAAGTASRCPPWLQAAIKDIEQRVRALAVSASSGGGADGAAEHSFAERAEDYYHRRPQLLALLTDLHRRYLYLADRYSQSLLLASSKSASASSGSGCGCCSDSDAGSSLSFQPDPPPTAADESGDVLVAELVMAWVSGDILADACSRREAASARRIELQGSLLEVLESERLVLLEQRNRECFEAMAAWEAERKVAVGEIERLRMENRRLAAAEADKKAAAAGGRRNKVGWWWLDRVRMAAEWTPCAPVRKVGEHVKGAGKDGVKYNGGCFCL